MQFSCTLLNGTKLQKNCGFRLKTLHLRPLLIHKRLIMNIKKHIRTYLGAITLVLACQATVAQKITVSPIPQEIKWSEKKAFNQNISFKAKGLKTADKDAVELLSKNFALNGKDVKLIIGKRGDKVVKKFNNLIPQKDEGYYLHIKPDEVVIAGNDAAGTYYGVQTFLQITSVPEVMCVTIIDYPDVAVRGIVEGFYGNPYSKEDRESMFDFFGKHKMNTYIYGPKDDIYHRAKWRMEYPIEQATQIKEYVKKAKANKVDFVWAIHPGNDIKWEKNDSLNMLHKLNSMYKLGIRTYAIFFDDIWGEGTNAERQAGLLNYLTNEFVKKHEDIKPLILCPTQYNRNWSRGNYLDILGENTYKDIDIMWTGNSVIDMINKEDMKWINNRIKRNAYIWLNYPVNDYCIDHMLMGPTYGNDIDIFSMLSGFVSNPMEYAEASKISLYSIADYTWNMSDYNAETSWLRAIKHIMPKHSEEFRLFCENNIDLGVTGHGLRRKGESPRFNTALETFNRLISEGDTSSATKHLSEHFKKMIVAAETMIAANDAPRLSKEIEPWCISMKLLSMKGLSIMSMYNALNNNDAKTFIDIYLKFQQYDKQQAEIRSRDFSGSIKSPTPTVATSFIVPFIKKSIAHLTNEYKNRYSYRLDVFPRQLIENGTYFIKVNGEYLTNEQENTPNTAPIFKKERDMIKPQRQEWLISIDIETGRYKIINKQDNRYLNENGTFSINNETNPYESSWHSYILQQNTNGYISIQNAGNAGQNYWKTDINDKRIRQSNSNKSNTENFIFEIIPVNNK